MADQRAPEAPQRVSDLRGSATGGVLKRTFKEFSDDNLTDLAAALTYYGVLSIFPMIIVIVSVLGLIGHSVTAPLIDNLSKVAPGPARQIFTSAIRNVQSHQGAAGVLFVAGLVGALWSASGYIAAFMRASNAVWDIDEGRPIYKTIPIRVLVTIVTVILITASALAVVLTGSLAHKVGNVIGLGSTAVTVFDIAKWPIMLLFVAVILSILYYAGPNVRQPGFRWVTPGSVLAVLAWLVVSGAFAFYVASFSSYNKTYGALGGIIAFLVWLWLTNVVILFGAELNAELERQRSIEAGHPPDEEPYLPPRDTPKSWTRSTSPSSS
ncbi:MAG TPA: YihY/virulence factor BrkB family protein [Solirubrobacteraceae bacterium]|jgi:membrane protein|nr:YihY/virulence factor BrkB family protein [Solirubrobacteraceae bacterium]